MPGKFEDLLADFRDIDGMFAALESVAGNYPESSIEHKAIELAAWGLGFAFETKSREVFKNYVDSSDGPLTDKQKEHLRSMDIDLE